jgi:hypothetical protein
MVRNGSQLSEATSPTKAGWRVNEWAHDVGLSRAFVYELLAARKIESVKIGSARVITTTPAQFLSNCEPA